MNRYKESGRASLPNSVSAAKGSERAVWLVGSVLLGFCANRQSCRGQQSRAARMPWKKMSLVRQRPTRGGRGLKAGVDTQSLKPAPQIARPFRNLPSWAPLVFGLFLAIFLGELDKVNLSVAVVPLAEEFSFSEAQVGIASTAFFWGYMLTQLPAAWLNQVIPGGPSTVLALGVLVQSVGTLGMTALASLPFGWENSALPILCVSRCIVGFGEGLGWPAIGQLLASVPQQDRASATSLSQAGGTIGAAVGLILCPYVINHLGWPIIFWGFGFLGFMWCAWWNQVSLAFQNTKPWTARATASSSKIPWRSILRNKPVWTVIATHALSNVGYYALLAWVPTWYTHGLGLGIQMAGALSFLPYIAGTLVAPAIGRTADGMLKRGRSLKEVRRICQAVAFLGPATCLSVVAVAGRWLNPLSQAGLLVLAQIFHTFNRAGLFCSHADLSPRYTGVLLALSTTAGAISPIAGIAAIGELVEITKSFSLGLFAPIVLLQIIGAVVWVRTSSFERQHFDDE